MIKLLRTESTYYIFHFFRFIVAPLLLNQSGETMYDSALFMSLFSENNNTIKQHFHE